MRFLVISDIHCRERAIHWSNRLVKEENLDAIIVLGDITHFGPASWAGEFFSKLDSPCYAVPGNCDPEGVTEMIERHAISLHKKKVDVGGYVLGGIGGSNLTIFNTPFEVPEVEIEAGLRPIMEKGMVLVVHCPPLGYNDLAGATRRHAGSTAIRKLVEEFPPQVVLSGHIHEARGIMEEGGTLYMNPGAAKDSFAGILDLKDRPRVKLLDRLPTQ